jgi:hypothetical protein
MSERIRKFEIEADKRQGVPFNTTSDRGFNFVCDTTRWSRLSGKN